VKASEVLLPIYEAHGAGAYFGEPVTISEHGLQAAYFAHAAGATEALIVAALLHDVGHLIEAAPDDIADWVTDAHHEVAGSRWLSRHFGPEVCEPVRLHVAAKRYLCATDASYFGRLSSASVHTLELQGGPMSASEIRAFEAERYGRDALLVRQCDDRGKIAGLRTPDFRSYCELIDRLSQRGERSG
jgi:[1-hydroxy-2-(trimethylamino)ethyl]phosphonate dioxygenase